MVQRAIVDYLVRGRKFPIYNSSSYGFIKGLGTRAAISRAIELRSNYDWCLKTDIEAFFDRIPRPHLKDRVVATLRNHSLAPLILRIIDCEIKEKGSVRAKLQKYGIKRGVGIRQGMPLSPILANLVLFNFDRAVERAGVDMIRYADDILLFFNSKEAACDGCDFVKRKLAELDLNIPELTDGSKTTIVGPREPIDFLGREIVYLGTHDKFVSRVARKQISKIRTQLENDYNYEARRSAASDFQKTIVDLWKSVSAYLGIYKDAQNFVVLDSELRAAARAIISDLLTDIFGEDALLRVDSRGRNFLGIGDLDVPEPVNDLDL
jgi:RNA-directed DNA polymerase